MKIFIDDVREAPVGWYRVTNFIDAIAALECHDSEIEAVSFDHDLGETGSTVRTGYDVVCWVEDRVYNGYFPILKTLKVHSSNPPGVLKIQQAIDSIMKMLEERKAAKSSVC